VPTSQAVAAVAADAARSAQSEHVEPAEPALDSDSYSDYGSSVVVAISVVGVFAQTVGSAHSEDYRPTATVGVEEVAEPESRCALVPSSDSRQN